MKLRTEIKAIEAWVVKEKKRTVRSYVFKILEK